MSDYDYQQAYILTDRVTMAPVGFFGRDGKEYLIDFGGGGSGATIDGEADTFAMLPSAGAHAGEVYLVKQTTGVWLINRKSGGLYLSDGVNWTIIIDYDTLVTKINENTAAIALKFDIPTGDTTQYVAGDGSLISFPVAGQAGTLVRQVRNETGSTLTKGQVIYLSGASGNKPLALLAIANSSTTSDRTFGVVQADITHNSNGYAVVSGDLSGLNTVALTEGAILYLSPTVAGGTTTTQPASPYHAVTLGVVTRSHATQGQFDVSIQNGFEIEDIHDVSLTSITDKDVLVYDSATSLWKNKQLAPSDITGLGTLATQSGTFSGTSSGTNTGDQNLFSTIAVSGQSNVVADSTTDTLTLVAGANITITTDAGTDTITINASGGGGGGGNSVTTIVSFGASFTDSASTVVTGQSWVTTGSEITAQVVCDSGVDPLEIALLDFKIVISDLVAGVGFTVTLYSMPHAKGDYSVMCIGV